MADEYQWCAKNSGPLLHQVGPRGSSLDLTAGDQHGRSSGTPVRTGCRGQLPISRRLSAHPIPAAVAVASDVDADELSRRAETASRFAVRPSSGTYGFGCLSAHDNSGEGSTPGPRPGKPSPSAADLAWSDCLACAAHNARPPGQVHRPPPAISPRACVDTRARAVDSASVARRTWAANVVPAYRPG